MSLLSKLSAKLRIPFDGLRDELRRRRARRVAEEIAAKEKVAEQTKAEELARQARLAEECAREVEAAERCKAQELARQTRLAQERIDQEAAYQRAIKEEAAHQRRIGNPFVLGGRYENQKGFYTVIALSGDKLRIRWEETEEEITCSAASQRRILRNMHGGGSYCDGEPPGIDSTSQNRPAKRTPSPKPLATNADEIALNVRPDEYYFSGKGHYGEQIGGFKPVMRHVHDYQPHDSLQKELWASHILVEVEALATSSMTGELTAVILGKDPHVQAAIDFCRTRTPPIEVLLSDRHLPNEDK